CLLSCRRQCSTVPALPDVVGGRPMYDHWGRGKSRHCGSLAPLCPADRCRHVTDDGQHHLRRHHNRPGWRYFTPALTRKRRFSWVRSWRHYGLMSDTAAEAKSANPKADEWTERIAAQQRSGTSVKQ